MPADIFHRRVIHTEALLTMTGIARAKAASITKWAERNPQIRRVWVFGSHAKGTDEPDSDIDIAVEPEPVADSEETLAVWMAKGEAWQAELQDHLAVKVNLEWFDPDGSTRAVAAALRDAKLLVYERAG